MKINEIELITFKLKNKYHFKANYGQFKTRELLLVKIYTDYGIGWGSCPTLGPYYSQETIGSARYIIKKVIGPAIIGANIESIDDYLKKITHIRDNEFAKASIEMALWELFSKYNNKPLYKYIGGNKDIVECGNSIGMINEEESKIFQKIYDSLDNGYNRIKLKITPGWDIKIIESVRKEFGNIKLSVDCNAGYSLKDLDILKELDSYKLEMIEQPLHYNDLYNHSLLQKEISTPICLDESIHSIDDVKTAIKLKSCKIINIKPSRVGGINETIKIHNICKENDIPIWCGGMHESGVGLAYSLAVATLPNFTLPSDIIPPLEYYNNDIIKDDFSLNKEGKIKLNHKPGFGIEIDGKKLNRVTTSVINIK
ncbi:MAG TPA: o-succinylbenzoate synthase [Halanaerobiales bacterium]|nr:o-succinylbenzoate synthase [Halanaerobiales bacterium]